MKRINLYFSIFATCIIARPLFSMEAPAKEARITLENLSLGKFKWASDEANDLLIKAIESDDFTLAKSALDQGARLCYQHKTFPFAKARNNREMIEWLKEHYAQRKAALMLLKQALIENSYQLLEEALTKCTEVYITLEDIVDAWSAVDLKFIRQEKQGNPLLFDGNIASRIRRHLARDEVAKILCEGSPSAEEANQMSGIFIDAAKCGNMDLIRHLLMHSSIPIRDEHLETIARECKHGELAQWFAKLNLKQFKKMLKLNDAIKQHDQAQFENALKGISNLNANIQEACTIDEEEETDEDPDKPDTNLWDHLIRLQDLNFARLLLDHGVSWYPIQLAAFHRKVTPGLLELLIEYGANFKTQASVEPNDVSVTALDYLVNYGAQEDCINMQKAMIWLIVHNDVLNEQNIEANDALGLSAEDVKKQLDEFLKQNFGLLGRSIINGDLELAEHLSASIQVRPDTILTSEQVTDLNMAMLLAAGRGHSAFLALLINTFGRILFIDQDRLYEAFNAAAFNGDSKIIETLYKLLCSRAEPGCMPYYLNRALLIAAAQGHSNVVQYLITTNINSEDASLNVQAAAERVLLLSHDHLTQEKRKSYTYIYNALMNYARLRAIDHVIQQGTQQADQLMNTDEIDSPNNSPEISPLRPGSSLYELAVNYAMELSSSEEDHVESMQTDVTLPSPLLRLPPELMTYIRRLATYPPFEFSPEKFTL